MSDAKVEKGPGHDWTVWYTDEADDGSEIVESMGIYGVMTAEEAIVEARYSLGVLVEYTGAIIRVERDDMRGK